MTEPNEDRLANLPVPLFATVMGLSGLALAWRAGETSWEGPAVASTGLTWLTTVLFAVLLSAYLSKFLQHRRQVLEEFRHPVKMNFFPAVSISLILLATLWRPDAPEFARALWVTGAIVHIILTLVTMGRWIGHHPVAIEQINPAWFIPVVGNILLPIGGIPLGFVELSWFFFSIGLVFWLVLMTLVFYRFIFHDPLPERMMPTLVILLAPPSVGFLSWIAIQGEVDAAARILYYVGAFLFLLLLTQVPTFLRLPFFLSWWAYSFPVAAFTVATLELGMRLDLPLMETAGVILLALTTVLILGLGKLTLREARAGRICVPE